MTVEQPVWDEQRAKDISAKLQRDAGAMQALVAEAVAGGMTEQEAIAALRDAFVSSLTTLALEEPVTFALVVANLIMTPELWT